MEGQCICSGAAGKGRSGLNTEAGETLSSQGAKRKSQQTPGICGTRERQGDLKSARNSLHLTKLRNQIKSYMVGKFTK